MNANVKEHRALLQNIAHRAMLERGLLPDFSTEALAELDQLQPAAAAKTDESVRDLTDLLWASIDNDDSRDLDQLTVAEALPGNKIKLLVAIADVDSLVKNGSAIDDHARHNTTSVYTAAMIFPMLPELLSTDLTSLNVNEDRLAIVVEMVIERGRFPSGFGDLSGAGPQSRASWPITVWRPGSTVAAAPEAITAVKGLAENLRLQDKAAQSMRNFRHIHGALSLETIEAKPIFDGDQIRDLEVEHKNRATDIIEDCMIAANGVTARYLTSHKFPSIRRVVRTPKRWDRIVELAAEHKFQSARRTRFKSAG